MKINNNNLSRPFSFERFFPPKERGNNIAVIKAPFSLGGPNQAAKDGPGALIKGGLLGFLNGLGHKLKVIEPPDVLTELQPSPQKDNRIINIDPIIQMNKWIAEQVSKALKDGFLPFTLGGDHSIAIGTISGIHDVLKKFGVLWIDRHLDKHSPKNTPSWRAHGMGAITATADAQYDPHPDFQDLLRIGSNQILPKVNPEHLVPFATGEKSRFVQGTRYYPMSYITRNGISRSISEAITYLKRRVPYIYVVWDIDSMNVTGTGTEGAGQLDIREGQVIAEEINQRIRLPGLLAGFELVEVAPSLEKPHLRGQTVAWATQIAGHTFGENLHNNFERLDQNIRVSGSEF